MSVFGFFLYPPVKNAISLFRFIYLFFMCYTIPGKIVSIENNIATIDYFGELRKARVIQTNKQDSKPNTQN